LSKIALTIRLFRSVTSARVRSAYYFRVAPTFQTGDERYLWLNTVLCVGLGRFTKTGLGYRIYEIR
jgi:hypothetical protein